MFRSSTIIRELALNIFKVIFMLKHSLFIMLLCGSMLWNGVCVVCTDMLPHNRIINKDIISPNVLT